MCSLTWEKSKKYLCLSKLFILWQKEKSSVIFSQRPSPCEMLRATRIWAWAVHGSARAQSNLGGLPTLLHTCHLEVLPVLLMVQCRSGWKESVPRLSNGKNGAEESDLCLVEYWVLSTLPGEYCSHTVQHFMVCTLDRMGPSTVRAERREPSCPKTNCRVGWRWSRGPALPALPGKPGRRTPSPWALIFSLL